MNKRALLITDVTRCFGPGGELPVPSSEEAAATTVSNINKLFKSADIFSGDFGELSLIIISRDWHDPNSPHFNKWPRHGVEFTEGSEFYPDLKIRADYVPVAIVSKGLGEVDGYSPFDPSPDVNIILIMPNGNAYPWKGDLDSLCKHFRVGSITNTGWAKNYCVEAGCLAAREKGYEVNLVTDATDGINVPTDPDNHMDNSDKRMQLAGVIFTTTDEVLRKFKSS